MPLVYADTSALFATLYPADDFSPSVLQAVEKASPDFVYWSYLRYELRHNIRRTRGGEDGEAAWLALRAAERTQARLQWQSELQIETILDSADELSSQIAPDFPAGSGDFIHIAAARRLQLLGDLDVFWTCDERQANAAKAAGLKARLFKV